MSDIDEPLDRAAQIFESLRRQTASGGKGPDSATSTEEPSDEDTSPLSTESTAPLDPVQSQELDEIPSDPFVDLSFEELEELTRPDQRRDELVDHQAEPAEHVSGVSEEPSSAPVAPELSLASEDRATTSASEPGATHEPAATAFDIGNQSLALPESGATDDLRPAVNEETEPAGAGQPADSDETETPDPITGAGESADQDLDTAETGDPPPTPVPDVAALPGKAKPVEEPTPDDQLTTMQGPPHADTTEPAALRWEDHPVDAPSGPSVFTAESTDAIEGTMRASDEQAGAAPLGSVDDPVPGAFGLELVDSLEPQASAPADPERAPTLPLPSGEFVPGPQDRDHSAAATSEGSPPESGPALNPVDVLTQPDTVAQTTPAPDPTPKPGREHEPTTWEEASAVAIEAGVPSPPPEDDPPAALSAPELRAPALPGLDEVVSPVERLREAAEAAIAQEHLTEPEVAQNRSMDGRHPGASRPLPRIMAIANQKGGVGKTTTAVNLGAALAELAYRVLVVDLDPQGNATTGLGINARRLQHSIYDVVLHDVPLEDVIEPTSVRNLFVVPATIDLAGAEVELVPAFSREMRLARALATVRDDYDFVLIDCPPSLGLLTVNAFAAASEVVVPIQCEYYALEGLSQLLRNVTLVKSNLNQPLEVSTIVLTMYDARTRLAEQVVSEVRQHFGDRVCRNVVPRTVRLSEAPSFGQPIIVFDSSSRGALAYRELAKEVSGGATQWSR